LVTAIEEDEDTRRSLFPPPGAPKRNGGFKKKHYHWQLAQKCFKTHPKYQKAFEKAVTSKLQDVWSGKIKNRLGVCVLGISCRTLNILTCQQNNRQDQDRD
jgi:hypothetical protein